MVKCALGSDLHLEFKGLTVTNPENADVLILAGDILIANDMHDHKGIDHTIDVMLVPQLGDRQLQALKFRTFLKQVSDVFPHVVYVAGNHEFYHGRWKGSLDHIREETSKFKNVHFLEDQCFVLDDVTFVGATLWTDCNKGDPLTSHSLRDLMNDYRLIRDDTRGFTPLRPAIAANRHHYSKKYINACVEGNPDRKFVVVTHHAPSFQSIKPAYKDDYLMNGGYASDLSDMILDRPQIKFWCHGHIHWNNDYMIGDTRVLTNPRGYPGEWAGYDTYQFKTFEV